MYIAYMYLIFAFHCYMPRKDLNANFMYKYMRNVKHLNENYWLGDKLHLLLIGYVICTIYFYGKKNTINISIYSFSTTSKA